MHKIGPRKIFTKALTKDLYNWKSLTNQKFANKGPAAYGNTTICQYYKLSEYIFVSEIFVNIPNVILSNVIAKELSKVYDNNLLNPLSLSWTILMSFLTLLSLVKNIFHNVHICNLCFHHEQFLFVFLNYWIDRRIFHNNYICDLWGLYKWFWCFFRLWE